MEKIIREEVQEDPDERLKDPDPLKMLERPVEEEEDHEEDNCSGVEEEDDHEEDNRGVVEEEEKVGSEEAVEEDSDDEGDEDDTEEDSDDEGDDQDDSEEDSDQGWDENGEPCLPFIGSTWEKPVVSCTAGPSYTIEEALDIVSSAFARHDKLFDEWHEMVDNNRTPSPVKPLYALPKVTRACASGSENCYHQQYWTGITSETAPAHPYFRPCSMMQVFSLRLSSPVDHSVNVYGSFSIRDCWEPRPNYLFKRSRDDPAMIPQGCSFLPLRSPSRGIYMLQYFLIDVDLWIKEEGDGSSDQHLFCGYVELDFQKAGYELMLKGRFQGDHYGLNMHYAYLLDSIETVIEVLAEAEHSSDVRFSAATSGLDDEIELYDGAFSGRGTILRHVVAVKKQEGLDVVLKTNDGLLYKWTFQAGVGVVAAPEHPVSGFAQYFVMNVSFRTRGKAASAWQWSCICNDVRVTETCL